MAVQNRAALTRKASHSLLTGGQDAGIGSPTAKSADEVKVELRYFTGWPKPCLHYRVLSELSEGSGQWTALPGLPLTKAVDGSFSATIPGAPAGIEFVCNDGAPAGWDKAPGDQNYVIRAPGKYTLKDGKIDQQLPPPRPPTLVVATEVGSTTVCLSWNPPQGMPDSEVRGYIVYRNNVSIHQGDSSLRWDDKGLKGNTEYVYEVATLNSQGVESPRCLGTSVTTNVPGKPGPPAWLKISATTPKSIDLAWRAPMDLGGASVTAYNVWRSQPDQHPSTAECVGTVIGRDLETGTDREVLEWKDTYVKQGQAWLYQVSAVHLPDSAMARSKSQAVLMEELRKKASNSLLSVEEGENEGPRCDAVTAKAEAMLKAPRMGDTEPHIMLQAFNWESCYNKTGWYNVVKQAVPGMRAAGIDMCWLPPPSQCVDDRGYLPGEWYNLDSKYGKEKELRNLLKDMHSNGICPIADVVINHRCGQKQDDKGKWTIFKNPDWESWAICRNDPSGVGQGAESTGENIEYAPDIDHRNKRIQEDSKAYLRWLMENVGFRAIRLDFVLGYGAWFQEQYVRAVGTPYAVAEYWHGDVQVLRNYVSATKGVVAVYDFPMYYTLKHCIHSNEFGGLKCDGRLPGMMGCDPVRSVTFVENHDTCHLEVVGGKFGDNAQVCRAYAFLLTHCGIPSIFWSDWADRGADVTKQLTALCKVRKGVGVHATSRVSIAAATGGLYASYVDGTKGCLAFKMGSNDWSPNGTGWVIEAFGPDYAVWTKKGK